MADDHRYDNDWLDDDAVERVLRGESVVAESATDADGPEKAARIAAERLDAALRSLITPLPDGPLPGEEAALTAFRAARGAAGAAAAAETAPAGPALADANGPTRATGPAGAAGSGFGAGSGPAGASGPASAAGAGAVAGSGLAGSGPVGSGSVGGRGSDAGTDLGPAAGSGAGDGRGSGVTRPVEVAGPGRAVARPGRAAVPGGRPVRGPHGGGRIRSFLQRPVKAALALTLAGCAVGGVAVAAGAGVLPVPFGRGGKEPAPAASVNAAERPGTGATGAPSPYGTPSPGPSAGKRTGEPDTHGSPRPGAGTSAPGGAPSGPGRSPSAPPRPGGERDTDDQGGTDDASGAPDGGGKVWATRICREFLASGKRVDEDAVRTLERNAASAGLTAVRTYCERLLSGVLEDTGTPTGEASAKPRTRSRISLPDPLRTPGVTLSDASAL
ncbi:hypothetical protein AB0K89_07650 [Streptomyces cinnamoneus]|uniref:hypothetical protein n=1 Tax=Streptomyces cinnamoneus TaxID=53446 RepID=UPI003418C8F3